MGQRSEEAAGSEACLAFCAPICEESRTSGRERGVLLFSAPTSRRWNLQQAAQGKSRRALEEHGEAVSRHSAQRQPPSGWEEGSDDRPGTREKSGCERLLPKQSGGRCRSGGRWNDDGARERLLPQAQSNFRSEIMRR